MIKHLIMQNKMNIKEVLLQWFIIFFNKKTAERGAVKSKIMPNQELAEKLSKPN